MKVEEINKVLGIKGRSQMYSYPMKYSATYKDISPIVVFM